MAHTIQVELDVAVDALLVYNTQHSIEGIFSFFRAPGYLKACQIELQGEHLLGAEVLPNLLDPSFLLPPLGVDRELEGSMG